MLRLGSRCSRVPREQGPGRQRRRVAPRAIRWGALCVRRTGVHAEIAGADLVAAAVSRRRSRSGSRAPVSVVAHREALSVGPVLGEPGVGASLLILGVKDPGCRIPTAIEDLWRVLVDQAVAGRAERPRRSWFTLMYGGIDRLQVPDRRELAGSMTRWGCRHLQDPPAPWEPCPRRARAGLSAPRVRHSAPGRDARQVVVPAAR